MVAVVADLRQEAYAARGHVGRRRVQQRAVVGEGNVVEVKIAVVDIKGDSLY